MVLLGLFRWHYTFAGQFLVAVLKNKDVGGLLLAFF